MKVSLKDKVFQNHMEIETRGGGRYIVVANTMINKWSGNSFLEGCEYSDDLKYVREHYDVCNKWDIMKATLNGEVIYDRYKVDWSKIKVDTKVLVRDRDDAEWKKRYFSKYEDGKVFTFTYGGDSWSSDNEYTCWKQAKLYEN